MNPSSILERLVSKENLSEQECYGILKEVFSGQVSPVILASFLTALRAKGESIDEMAGFARAMQESMVKILCNSPVIVDTCGTGGDGKGTFNISTASAFVAAGAGVPVAKHGNRSVSSRCGSADVLESAGVKVDMPKETSERCLKEVGITFLFAPLYHPAMKAVAPARKELGIRTVFNLLGPLVNPAGTNVQVIGVSKKELVPVIASVLKKMNKGRKYSALVLHESGYDEMVLFGKCRIAEIKNNQVQNYDLTPKDLGLKKLKKGSFLKGGSAPENARNLREVLSGRGHPLEEVVIANAGLALFCAGQIKSFGASPISKKQAVQKAKESISSGAALKKLDQLVEYSHQ